MARTKKTPQRDPKPLSPLPPNTEAIVRTGPSSVVYHLPTSPPSPGTLALKTTILLPQDSTWTSGLHWHNSHTEYLRLVKGAIFVRLGNTTKIISAAAGGAWMFRFPAEGGLQLTVEKGVRHNWGRAQKYYFRRYIGVPRDRFPPDLNDDVVVEEWTDPVDIGKPLFFWNLNGVINAPVPDPALERPLQRFVRKGLGSWWIPFQLFVVFWYLDNFPVFWEIFYTTEQDQWWALEKAEEVWQCLSTYSVLWVVSLIAKMAEVKAVTEGRTPKDLWEDWKQTQVLSKKDE